MPDSGFARLSAPPSSSDMHVTTNKALATPLLSVMNFLNEIAHAYPDAISFAPGRPPEKFFDVAGALANVVRFVEHSAKKSGATKDDTFRALGQYGRTNGIIQELIARHLDVDEGIHATPEAIVVTTGAQEAMMILLQTLFDPTRDTLLVSDPSYIGITGAAALLGIPVAPVPCAEDGLDLDALERTVVRLRASGRTPKAVYDIPDFHNPLGTTMPLLARRRLLDLAHEHSLLVLEDNPYGIFAYDGERLPTLKALDTRGNVVYIGTFSKSLFPGLRVGFAVADQPLAGAASGTLLAHELSKVKSLVTVNTSPLLQAMVGGTLLEHEGSLVTLNRERVAFYKASRDRMLACLERRFGGDAVLSPHVTWNRPRGGFFLTLSLPFAVDEEQVRACARDYGVICCPMSFFSLAPGHERTIRLSFSYVDEDQIERGIESLWRFVRDTHARLEAVRDEPSAPVRATTSEAPAPRNLEDYERAARARLPAAVADYVAGGSDDELTLRDNRAAFARLRLRPRVLVDVEHCDTETTVLGTRVDSPILVAPMGYQRLVDPDGELATARAARAAGTVMVVSTMSTCALEDIAAIGGPLWFQLYPMRDRHLTEALVQRAASAGYRALVVTVDVPRLGRRERDLTSSFALPPHLVPANLGAGHAQNLHATRAGTSSVAAHASLHFDASMTWETLAWLRSLTTLPLVMKGVLTAEDARRSIDHGADAIIVSNHGGRQLDGVPASIDALGPIARAAKEECEIYLDGGVRRGTDVLKALALGARAVLVGRPVMWGLALGGEEGARRVLEHLHEDTRLGMALAGRPTIGSIDRSLIHDER